MVLARITKKEHECDLEEEKRSQKALKGLLGLSLNHVSISSRSVPDESRASWQKKVEGSEERTPVFAPIPLGTSVSAALCRSQPATGVHRHDACHGMADVQHESHDTISVSFPIQESPKDFADASSPFRFPFRNP